jgi:hypothetical protein
MATTKIFSIDRKARKLIPLERLSLAQVEAKETRDLESWLASAGSSAFERRVLWLARQDRASHEDRSDLIGIDERGNVVISELKIVDVDENAVTQALVYASTYRSFGKADLAALWASQSTKASSTPLVEKADSIDEAEKRIDDFLGSSAGIDEEAIPINAGQTILLIGPSFTARCLAVCDYLTSASDPSRIAIECWSVTVHGDKDDPILALELVFPPQNSRALIESKREEALQNKYARDPHRKTATAALIEALKDQDVNGEALSVYQGKGGSYNCRLSLKTWPDDAELVFKIDREKNWLQVPAMLKLGTLPLGTTQTDGEDGITYVTWEERDLNETSKLAAALVEVVRSISADINAAEAAEDTH